jgi:hypothetical protein
MSNDGELWSFEERFWTGDEGFYNERIAPGCVMVFPKPAGILIGTAILDALRGAPRWTSVEMAGRQSGHAAADTVTLAYEAKGERQGHDPYTALCSSTYRKVGGKWVLVQHQQTPIEA